MGGFLRPNHSEQVASHGEIQNPQEVVTSFQVLRRYASPAVVTMNTEPHAIQQVVDVEVRKVVALAHNIIQSILKQCQLWLNLLK